MIELHLLGPLSLQDEDGGAILSVLAAPKRLAFLSYLALARPGEFHRRDSLLALFWPESAERQARTSLRNMLFELRQALGRDVLVNRGAGEVGLEKDRLRCDAWAFAEAAEAGRLEEALELYRGDLLEGFHAPSVSAGFEHWLDGERDRLRRMAVEAAWTLAAEAESAVHPREAVRWGRRAAELSPWDEAVLRRLLGLLERVEGPGAALRAYDEFAHRHRAEWQEEPGAKTRRFAEELRERQRNALAAAIRPAPVTPGGRRLGEDPDEPPPSAGRRRRRLLALLGGVAALVVGMAVLARVPGRPSGVPVIAVGQLHTRGLADTADFAPALRSLIAASLARSADLQVIGVERLHELAGHTASPDGWSPGAWSLAARRAGAEMLIEGTILAEPDGRYHLSLSRRDLRTGRVEDSAVASGADPYLLVHTATARLLDELGIGLPPLRVAGATTRSLAAYRFYEEGLRAYYAGDNAAAHRLLGTALERDSAFAMAAYYRALSQEDVDHRAFRRDLDRAARLARRASDRERLLIRSAWAQEMDEPRQLALAETLAIRYPHEPDGHLFLGKARLWSGDIPGALPHLDRVLQMDSFSLGGGEARCRACDALQDIVTAHLLADSLRRAEAVARGWVKRQPGSARPWQHLARALEYQGRGSEALEARQRAASLRGRENPRDPLYPVVLAIRAGEFARADPLLAALERPGASLVQQNVLWYRTLSLLYRGRFEEALHSARAYREMVLRAEVPAQRRPWESVLEAQVLFEMGRPREAARLWRAMAEYPYEPESPARTARHRAWTLTHLATALAAAGDTAELPALADTIMVLGARSAYGRDPRLHHYVRGLLLSARGETEEAAPAFRRALFSPTAGYGRVNVELGRALLALGEPHEAARVLGGALRGPLDAGNLYVSRTEIHELLARALRSGGRPDSARVHERWAARARRR